MTFAKCHDKSKFQTVFLITKNSSTIWLHKIPRGENGLKTMLKHDIPYWLFFLIISNRLSWVFFLLFNPFKHHFSLHNGTPWNSKTRNKQYYYSFKIISRFWLAKSTRLIHHNQLLMTKFGRILCLTGKWRQKCRVLSA